MNQKIKYAALGIALACTGWTGASAEQVYELNPVMVTAQRMETTDLKTPAAVEVLTADEIQKTGATSVHEALKFSTGIIMHAQGPRNISQGTMTNKVVIRGVEKGTLVLVDGVPINQSGRYNLENIPTDAVEKLKLSVVVVQYFMVPKLPAVLSISSRKEKETTESRQESGTTVYRTMQAASSRGRLDLLTSMTTLDTFRKFQLLHWKPANAAVLQGDCIMTYSWGAQ